MDPLLKNNGGNLVENKRGIYYMLKKYVFNPLRDGFFGFSLVFAVIFLVKLLSFLLGLNDSFNFDLVDVLLSSVGFFFMFLVYFLKKLHI